MLDRLFICVIQGIMTLTKTELIAQSEDMLLPKKGTIIIIIINAQQACAQRYSTHFVYVFVCLFLVCCL